MSPDIAECPQKCRTAPIENPWDKWNRVPAVLCIPNVCRDRQKSDLCVLWFLVSELGVKAQLWYLQDKSFRKITWCLWAWVSLSANWNRDEMCISGMTPGAHAKAVPGWSCCAPSPVLPAMGTWDGRKAGPCPRRGGGLQGDLFLVVRPEEQKRGLAQTESGGSVWGLCFLIQFCWKTDKQTSASI